MAWASAVRLELQGIVSSVRLDTGSVRSVMGEDFVKTLGVTVAELQPEEIGLLQCVAKSPLKILGKCEISLKKDSKEISHVFLVVKDLTFTCALGIDFLSKFNVQINYSTGEVRIDGLEEVSLLPSSDFSNTENLILSVFDASSDEVLD